MSRSASPGVAEAMGRHVFGVAALLLGVASLGLHDQLVSEWWLPGTAVFIFITSIAQIVGGAAMMFRKTAGPGAVTLGVVYLIFTLTFFHDIVAQPGAYWSWGDLFYQLALVIGAVVAYGLAVSSKPLAASFLRGAVIAFGLCNISFAIEQVEFQTRTVSLVPHWVPLGGTFWADATTAAFALAGISLVVGYKSLLASRLLTVMLLIFTVAIWIPMLIADPKTHSNWSEGIETLATAGVAWIVADYLARPRRTA